MSERAWERDVYDAIADPSRRKILRLLADSPELPLHVLTGQFPMGRTAVSKHLAILKEAGLVIDRKVGRETRYRLNAAPLREVQDWVSYYRQFWSEKMMLLHQLLQEDPDLNTPAKLNVELDFRFDSPVDNVWKALTDPEWLAKWIMDNDFRPIVGYRFQFRGEPTPWWNGVVDCRVLEVELSAKLSYTWASAGENTTVTWTLQSDDGGTVLHLQQIGFKGEAEANGAAAGWRKMADRLAEQLRHMQR
jgi:uncharacterized protein YndB with AHSA1/START domain/DNA-binding transcriptional ArsR family regulator